MEKEAFKKFRDSIDIRKTIKQYCKKHNIICGNITEKNKSQKLNYFIKEYQKKVKKDIKYLLGKEEIEYGFVYEKIGYEKRDNYISITDKKTYIILDQYLYELENDIIYDFYEIFDILSEILEYNKFYKKINKVTKNKKKLIDLYNFDKMSQILEYKDLMKNQYNVLENYFNNTKFPNQLKNNIINNFVHTISDMKLELLLKSGSNKFINPVSGNTYDSERGIYTTLKTDKCKIPRWSGYNATLVFSKELANDFGYIFNFSYQFGVVKEDSLIKGQYFKVKGKEYSAVEKGAILLCKKDNRAHEVVFYTDHIKLKDYLEAIIFQDEEQYKLFKNMKDIKYKNKMKFSSFRT